MRCHTPRVRKGALLAALAAVAATASCAALAAPAAMVTPDAAAQSAVSAVFFPLNGTGVSTGDYELEALVYALQGVVNRVAAGEQRHARGAASKSSALPMLFYDTGTLDLDFPASDSIWRTWLAAHRGVVWSSVGPPGDVCALLRSFSARGALRGQVRYPSDGYSVFVALTMAGLLDAVPVSESLVRRLDCVAPSEALPVLRDLGTYAWPDKLSATRWAVDHLLPNCSRTMAWNADMFNNAVASQGNATIMSVDAAVRERAFIMDLSVLFKCDPLDCTPPSPRVGTPKEAELYVEIVSQLDELVSIWGWSDPEHAYTNVTSHAGGVVFCTFSAPNLSFWKALGVVLNSTGKPMPRHDGGRKLSSETTYVLFETKSVAALHCRALRDVLTHARCCSEGDTPRILTSQFTSAWLSQNRGSVPVAWAVDPLLAGELPELWNAYALTATKNDTFVAGVDGAGYIFVDSLGPHAGAYERRAAKYMTEYGLNVVDVGVASNKWPATPLSDIKAYQAATSRTAGTQPPDAYLNACGSAWGQTVNEWLHDGTPVVNSVCVGPPANDTSNGHYLYYYRGGLNASEPAVDLAGRIRWASASYKIAGRPLFLLVFGGLGLYGGHSDFFTFLSAVLDNLGEGFVAVGGPELARLAREAAPTG